MPNEVVKPGVEPDNINPKVMVGFAVGLTAAIVATFFGMRMVYRHFDQQFDSAENKETRVIASVAQTVSSFPQPHEQFSPQLDLKTFREQESNALNGFGWVNRDSGLVHIPIKLAMEQLIQSNRMRSDGASAGPSSLQLQQARPAQRDSSLTNAPQ